MKQSDFFNPPKGWLSGGVKIDEKNKTGMLYSLFPARAEALFTKNFFKSASTLLAKKTFETSKNFRCIFVNSGNANAATGKRGISNAIKIVNVVSKKLSIKTDEVFIASTGVIGKQLEVEKLTKAINNILLSGNRHAFHTFSRMIMTTDTKPKLVFRSFKNSNFLCISKGSGMIAPSMATMLSFLISDVRINYSVKDIYMEVIDKTLNSITIDGETSTNDTAVFMWNMLGDVIDKDSLKKILLDIYTETAYRIVEDGEGATKVIEVSVVDATNTIEAKRIAKRVAESLLVKTAIFGSDPNWGRIYAAAGRDPGLDENRISISVNDVVVFRNGSPARVNTDLKKILKNSKYVRIKISLGKGNAKYRILSTDLSYEYIKINSSYTT